MKLGTNELTFTAVPAGTCTPASVLVKQRAFGVTMGTASMTIEEARTMAAEIQLAADVAEGKS